MRRTIVSLIALIVFGAAGFYGAWPAWTLSRLKAAFDGGDAATVSAKIDFASVRLALRPYAINEMGKALDDMQAPGGLPGGLGGVLGGDLKQQLQAKVVDALLTGLVTPESLLRLYAEGKSLKELIGEAKAGAGAGAGKADAGGVGGLGKVIGGLLGKKADGTAPAAPARDPVTTTSSVGSPGKGEASARKAYGLANIKGFGLTNASGLWFGVARDKDAAKADVLIDMAFTGGDWKIVGIRPQS